MQKRLTLISLLLFLFQLFSYSQEKLNYHKTESLTYQNYIDRNWDDLIKNGKMALKNGYDYYYLRMRMGIAYYENKHYRKSAIQFEKAFKLNNTDPVTGEYLYYAYLWGGRSSDARYIFSILPQQTREKIDPSDGFIESVEISCSYKFFNNPQLIDNFPENTDILPNGSQSLTRSYTNYSINLAHRLGNRVQAYHQIGMLNLLNLRYDQDSEDIITNKEEEGRQLDYYLSLNWLAGKGFGIRPAIHYFNISLPNYDITGSTGMGRQSASKNNIIINQYVVSLELNKDIRNFNIGISGSYSNLNQMQQIQQSFNLTYFPLGNLNLYETTTITHHSGYFETSMTNDNLIFGQSLGFKITNHLWMELEGFFGNLSNSNINNGSVVFNSPDNTKWLAGGSFIIPFGKKNSQFILSYYYQENESFFFPDDTTIPLYNITSFTSNLIRGGIKWNF